MLKSAWAIAWKDVIGDFRRKSTLSSMLFFAIAALVVFQAAFEPSRQEAIKLLPGLIWVTVLFMVLVGLGRVFQVEEEDGAFVQLLISPLPRGVFFAGKWLGNLFLVLLIELLLTPLTMILFNVDAWSKLPALWGILFLGTLGLTGLGVLLATLTQAARGRETLLALLLLPLAVPLLIAGIQSMGGVLADKDFQSIKSWILLLTVFDTVYLTLAPWAFSWWVEE
ncbi:heme exporter protein CcmB [Magnetococcales bacterium HHB-1]